MKHAPSFALNAEWHAVSIGEVSSGRACNCFCAGCGEPLVAKKGQCVQHHFAHSKNSNCVGAVESSLHLAVKTLLERRKTLLLPDCYAFYTPNVIDTKMRYVRSDPRDMGHQAFHFDRSYPNSGVGHMPGKCVFFDRIAVEQNEGAIRPDLVGYVGDTKLYIEVAVTHFVDAGKMAKLKERGISTLELIFSDIHKAGWTWQTLEKRLFEESYGKEWLINRKAEQLAYADQKARVERIGPILAEEAQRRPTHVYGFQTGDFRYFTPRLVHNMYFSLSLKHLEIRSDGDWREEPTATLLAMLRQRDAVWNYVNGHCYLPADYQAMLAFAAEFKMEISRYFPRISVRCADDRQYKEMCHAVKISSRRNVFE